MRTTPVSHVRQQSSIDTLVHRIGDLDIAKGEKIAPRKAIPVPQGAAPPRKKPGFFALLCCGGLSSSDDDYCEVVRHKKRPEQSQRQPEMTVRFQEQPMHQHPRFTSRMRNCIPTSLPAHTAAMLQSELSKPPSPADEPGYIYMFWIEEDATPPVKDVVHSLVDYRSPRYTAIPLPPPIMPNGHKQIMVKIGRATNVHRRLSSWSRQCGYNLSLLRFYPHVSDSHMAVGSTNPSPAEKGIRKVPFSHRVERLIHIELAGRRVKQGKCNACGREHREWFAIDATRAGVRDVDEVIQRWVRWAETQPALT